MAHKTKTEHAGAKNGGGYWGPREDAKARCRSLRRAQGKAEIRKALHQPKTWATYQVTADHFCAGVVFHDGVVAITAPILKWARGKALGQFLRVCRERGYQVQLVE